jgi:hypothetical protein
MWQTASSSTTSRTAFSTSRSAPTALRDRSCRCR